jgi:O-antigen/teichoic acid export membrane protein
MKKKLLIDLLIIILLNVLIKPVAIFGIDAAVQNRLGSDTYGLYFSLLNLSYLFNIVMDLGINNYTTRNVAQYPHIVPSYLGKIIGLRLILFVIYALITLVFGLAIGYRDGAIYILGILIFNQFLNTLILYVRSHLGGLHLFRTDAIISVLDKFLLIIICGYLLLTTTDYFFKIEWLIWSQTIAYALTLVVGLTLLIKHIGLPTLKFKWAFSYAIIRQSLPFALLALLMMLYTRTDSIMLERIHEHGAYQAGLYAKGFRLLDTLFMFGMLFATLLLPVFSRLLKEKSAEIILLLESARDVLVGGAIVIAFISMHLATLILGWIYTADINDAAPSFILLMWSFVAMTFTLVYGTLLTAKGDLRFLNFSSALSIGINIGLNYVLIPKYGATGAACATLATQSFIAICQFVRAHQTFSAIQPMKTFLKFGALILSMLLMDLFLPEKTWVFFLECCVGLILLLAFRLIDVHRIRLALSEKV